VCITVARVARLLGFRPCISSVPVGVIAAENKRPSEYLLKWWFPLLSALVMVGELCNVQVLDPGERMFGLYGGIKATAAAAMDLCPPPSAPSLLVSTPTPSRWARGCVQEPLSGCYLAPW
jgi:hypothetical protein